MNIVTAVVFCVGLISFVVTATSVRNEEDKKVCEIAARICAVCLYALIGCIGYYIAFFLGKL